MGSVRQHFFLKEMYTFKINQKCQ